MEPKPAFESLKSLQMCLVKLVSTTSPSIGLIDEAHSFEHQQAQVFPCLVEFSAQLGSDSTGLTNKRRGDADPGISKSPSGRKPTAEGLPNPDAPNVIRGPAREKLMAMKSKTSKCKSAQVLILILANPLTTTHATALPGPDATPPLGVGKFCPTA